MGSCGEIWTASFPGDTPAFFEVDESYCYDGFRGFSRTNWASERRRDDTPGPGEGLPIDRHRLPGGFQGVDHGLHGDVARRARGVGAAADPAGAGVEDRDPAAPRGQDVVHSVAVGVVEVHRQALGRDRLEQLVEQDLDVLPPGPADRVADRNLVDP